MPATCFKRLPPSAGVIAQRCLLSLQPLSEAWLRYARFQPFAASCMHWWAKMHYHKAPYSCWRGRCGTAPPRSKLASCKTLACRPASQNSAKQGLTTKPKARKWCTVTVQIRPRSINRLRIARGPAAVPMSAGSETS